MSRVDVAQVRRSRSVLRTLTGRPAIRVSITYGNTTWTAQARTLDKAWDAARAAASLLSNVTLPYRHPWHPEHEPVTRRRDTERQEWDSEDVDALYAAEDAALDLDASVSESPGNERGR